MYLPWIIKDVVDKVLVDKDTVMLNYIAASIIIVFIVRGLFFYGQSYLMSWVGQKVVIDVRGDIFRKLQRLSMSFYDKNKTGTIMSYVTNDVAAMQTAMVDKAVEFVTEGLILVGSIAAMFVAGLETDTVYLLYIPGCFVVHGLFRQENPQKWRRNTGLHGRTDLRFAGERIFSACY